MLLLIVSKVLFYIIFTIISNNKVFRNTSLSVVCNTFDKLSFNNLSHCSRVFINMSKNLFSASS
jgi:hypothetical protein